MTPASPDFARSLDASARGTPLADVGNARRRAALLLHAMTSDDRTWVLKSLPDAARQTLIPLLRELEALGLECDAGFFSMVEGSTQTASAEGSTVPTGDIDDESYLLALDEAGVLRLASLLRPEPASVVTRLLGIRAWPWQPKLLQALDEPTRRQVSEVRTMESSAIGCPPALRMAIMRTLRSRLQDDPAIVPGKSKDPWWRRPWPNLRQSSRVARPSGGIPS